MATRLMLHDKLLKLQTGLNVYFQKPPNTGMKYPCIVYGLDGINTDHANNQPYRRAKRWQVTVIDRNSDMPISDLVGQLSSATFSRRFVVDDLYHDVYTLYF